MTGACWDVLVGRSSAPRRATIARRPCGGLREDRAPRDRGGGDGALGRRLLRPRSRAGSCARRRRRKAPRWPARSPPASSAAACSRAPRCLRSSRRTKIPASSRRRRAAPSPRLSSARSRQRLGPARGRRDPAARGSRRRSRPGADLRGRRQRDLFLHGARVRSGRRRGGRDLRRVRARLRRVGISLTASRDAPRRRSRRGGRARVRALPRAARRIARRPTAAPDSRRLAREGQSHAVVREPDGVRRLRRVWIAREEGAAMNRDPLAASSLLSALDRIARCASTPPRPRAGAPEPITPADFVASIADVAAGRNAAMAEAGLVLKRIEFQLVGRHGDEGGRQALEVLLLDAEASQTGETAFVQELHPRDAAGPRPQGRRAAARAGRARVRRRRHEHRARPRPRRGRRRPAPAASARSS